MTKTATHLALLTAFTALTLGACGKDDKAGTSDTPSSSAAKTVNAEPAKLAAVSIASMALTLDVPAESLVSDNTATAGFPSGTLYADPTIFVIGANEMFWKNDLAAQKAEIEKDPGNTFKKFTKEEAVEGGFHLEYELASMLDPKETLYGFHVRATIGGKEVDCSSNTQSPPEMARGVKMCKSLRASK
jgi:hypothetical protein